MAQVYLTFDDGPLFGTDDVIAVLGETGARGTLFMVADHVRSPWQRRVLRDAQASAFVQVANHSKTHANNRYREYYRKDPSEILANYRLANGAFGLDRPPFDARLPGRNTWRVDGIERTSLASGPAANILARHGFRVYGWDVEWPHNRGIPVGTPEQVAARIDAMAGRAARPGKVIVLMHDVQFRQSTGQRGKLLRLIRILQEAGHSLEFISDY
jgi:peptidoglycan/xylan/chitin deacetylase (PgdA/CDA1 family)